MERMLISGWKVKPATTYSFNSMKEVRGEATAEKKSLKLAEIGS